MSLPKIAVPTYTLTLPSNGKKINYRPYLVKEQKILLMASVPGATFEDVYNAIKQIAINCTFGEVDIESIPLFDFEYIFLNIRAKSVGEIITPSIKCDKCDKDVMVTINLGDIKVTKLTDRTIKLSENIGIVLNYPSFSISKIEAKPDGSPDDDYRAIYDCVDYVYEGSQVFTKKDFTYEEFVSSFIELLSDTDYQKISDFFINMPRIYLETDMKCKCGQTKKIEISGIQDFLY